MKKDGLILPILTLLSIVLMLSLVSSALTINTPTLNQAVNGTFKFNVTSDLSAVQNCSFATTGDGVFGFSKNTTVQTEFINSSNTALLTNAYHTTLNVTCRNNSNIQSATRIFSIDNSNPTCAFLMSSTFVKRQSGLGISTTQNSAGITTLTYLWNLTNELGNQEATSTDSAPTFSNGDLSTLGTDTLSLTVTNEVNNKVSCNDTFLVKTANEETSEQVVAQTVQTQNRTNTILIVGGIFLFLVIVIVSVFVLLNETKKGKRRR